MRFAIKPLVVFACCISIGCAQNNPNIWDQVKMTDLTPAANSESAALPTINIVMHIFETEVSRFNDLEKIWPILKTDPIRFNDENRFEQNSFRVGFGQAEKWPDIAELLYEAESHRAERNAMLLKRGNENEIPVISLPRERKISYVGQDESLEQIELARGDICFQLMADSIPGSRGVARVEIMPIFQPDVHPLPGVEMDRLGWQEFDFLGMRADMTPGDFIIISAKSPIQDDRTLAGTILSKYQHHRHLLRTFVIVCTDTND